MDSKTVVRILTDVTGFLPGASPIHGLLAMHPDQAALLVDVISNLGEGESAVAAAERAAPELTVAIKNLVGSLGTALPNTAAHVVNSESFLRSLGGLGRMTPDEELDWMNRTTAQISDSRNGSG